VTDPLTFMGTVTQTQAPTSTVLHVDGLAKAFGATTALRHCSLALRAGEIHALIGENGSGKSTLVKILAGVHRPDTGQVLLRQEPLRTRSPRAAIGAGIATVFQEVQCVPAQSVLENLWLGYDGILRRARISPAQRRDRAREVLTELLGRCPDLGAAARSLSLSERQGVAICRALLRDPTILILDEASSALDVATRDRLFACMRRLTAAGHAVLFISHRMDEVTQVADRITVLRSGESVATLDRADAGADRLVELMTGGEQLVQAEATAPERAQAGDVVLAAGGLNLRSGEIVGLAGLEGQGQDEYLQALRLGRAATAAGGSSGDPGSSGGLGSSRGPGGPGGAGSPGGPGGPAVRIEYVARDRRDESIFPPLSVRENFTAATLRQDVRGLLISARRASARFEPYRSRLRIRLGRDRDPITTLSGGNQQKVVIARALAADPQVLLLNDPTRGIDIGAKRDIYALLRELAARGAAPTPHTPENPAPSPGTSPPHTPGSPSPGMGIVMLSTEVDEHLELMDRVLVFRDGRPAAELGRDQLSRASIVREFFGPAAAEDTAQPPQPAPAAKRQAQRPAPPTPLSPPTSSGQGWRAADRAWLLPAVLAVALLVANVAVQHSFLYWSSWIVTFAELATPALAAMASTPAILGGGIDISIAPLFTMVSVVIEVVLLGHGITSAAVILPVSVLFGAAVGAFNGALVNYGRYQAVVATLCMNFILSGFALAYAPSPVSGTTGWLTSLGSTVGGVPGGLILIVVPLLAWFGLDRTPFVRTLRAVGGSETTAYTAGVNVAAVRTLAYTCGGAIAGVAGVAIVAQLHQAEADSAFVTPFILLAIAAVALGGTSLAGGRGGMLGSLLGAAVIFLIENLLAALNISSFWSQACYGAVLIVAIMFAARQRAARKALR
jgi:ABC-type sugar transport system ATPase subunit/ribose/xylose/arabinose/galactoside ABC-type transport system permease subunit